MGTRLARGVPLGEAIHTPITGVLCGRRNNPVSADGKVPALACHNPLHYYQLPELFMEITSSMTGKSPSTTGAGSEGALTKVSDLDDLSTIFLGQTSLGTDLSSTFLRQTFLRYMPTSNFRNIL